MNQTIITDITQGLTTVFIDHTVSSNLAYRPQFVSNNYKEGRKVISSIEDELLSCEQFAISVAFITMSGITPLLQTLKELEKRGIAYDVCPGVSAFCGAAAALKAEYTLPDVSQTVIITRTAGRTPVPERESIRALAAHQATMVLFLSTSLTEQLQAELLAGGYPGTTPVAVVYKATWPEQKIFRCTVDTLHRTVTENGLTKTSLIIVGNCMGDTYMRSLLYHPEFTTEFREATV